MSNNKTSLGNHLSNKVIININMFATIMINWVKSEINSRDIITTENHRTSKEMASVSNKLLEPNGFYSCVGNNPVFSFSGGFRDSRLLFRTPGNKILPKKNSIASSRTSPYRGILPNLH